MAYEQPVGQPLTNAISSTFDFIEQPSIQMTLFKKYGVDFYNTMVSHFRNIGAEFPVANDFLEAHEEDLPYVAITCKSSAVVSSDFVIEIGDDDVDAQGNYYPRVDYSVQYQHTDNIMYELVIQSITAAGGGDNAKLVTRPLAADADLAVGDIVISDGASLSIGGTSFAPATDMPAGTVSGYFETTFKPYLVKETVDMDGTELAKAKWYEIQKDGYNSIWAEFMFKQDLLVDIQEEAKIMFGNENDRALTQADSRSTTGVRQSTKGLWNHVVDNGGELPYGNDEFGFNTLSVGNEYLRTQGFASGMVSFKVSPLLSEKVDQGGYEFGKETSGGADYTRVVNQLYGGSEEIAAGVNFKVFRYGAFTYVVDTLDTLGNERLAGNKTYDLYKSGFMCPAGDMVRNAADGNMYPNVGLGNIQHTMIDRKRVFKVINGITGLIGYDSFKTADTVQTHVMVNRLLSAMETNKWLYVIP